MRAVDSCLRGCSWSASSGAVRNLGVAAGGQEECLSSPGSMDLGDEDVGMGLQGSGVIRAVRVSHSLGLQVCVCVCVYGGGGGTGQLVQGASFSRLKPWVPGEVLWGLGPRL